MFVAEMKTSRSGIFDSEIRPSLKRRTTLIVLVTGTLFGLSTYFYVLAFEKAGAVSAAIAIQAYPLFAILWETLFLGRRKTALELAFTFLLIGALYFLATDGTWTIHGLSFWFVFALSVPFLWSVAHVILKEVLDRTPITPAQVIFFRVLVSSVLLGCIVLTVYDVDVIVRDLFEITFQKFALIMGLVYYIELINWFYAVRHIDISVASSIAVPSPALTMVLAVLFLGETIAVYQVVTLGIVILSLYGLLFAGGRKAKVS